MKLLAKKVHIQGMPQYLNFLSFTFSPLNFNYYHFILVFVEAFIPKKLADKVHKQEPQCEWL